jgi:hypothetical protein
MILYVSTFVPKYIVVKARTEACIDIQKQDPQVLGLSKMRANLHSLILGVLDFVHNFNNAYLVMDANFQPRLKQARRT